MKHKGFRYLIDCVHSGGHSITAMVDAEREISRRSFLRHVDRENLREVEAGLGYAGHWRQGLTMAGDWAVSYYRSEYRGRPCYFFRWSSIEHIFTAGASGLGLCYGRGDV